MTVAKNVPWGIPPPDGIPVSALARYLGLDRATVAAHAKRLGIHRYWGPPKDQAWRKTRSLGMLVSEEDAARLIVHVRAREGKKLLSAREREASATARGQAIPPDESTAE